MGLGSFGPLQLLIVAGLIILIFGTKKLRNLGGDLGASIKGFKKAMSEDEKPQDQLTDGDDEGTTINAKAEKVEESK